MVARGRRPSLATVALGVLTVAAVALAISVVGSPASTGAQERLVPVSRGVVQSTVSGTGNLVPANQLDLSFGTSGEVVKIYVKEGQHVHAGQLLARLDASSARVDLAQAKADLQSAQDTLNSVGASTATASTSAVDTAAVATAAATAPTTTAPARKTPAATAPAKTTPTKTTPSGSGNSNSSQKSSGQSGSSSGTVSAAAARAAYESAKLGVKSAENALAATRLRAPMAGTIAAVDGSVGQTVGSQSSSSSSSSGAGADSAGGGAGGSGSSSGSNSSGLITLAQLSRYRMDVALTESDIGKVKVGQPATITINASGQEFAARVTEIGVLSSSSSSSSSSNGTSSAVSYPVTLTLDQTAKTLKAGMSASADIVVAQASGIVVPTQAIQGGSVTAVRAGKRTTQRVTVGIAGDSTTQVISGVKVGDQVAVTSASAAAGASAAGASGTGRQGTPGGFGGGPPGGGLGGGGFGGGRLRFRGPG